MQRICIVCGKVYTNTGRQCNSCRNKLWKANNRKKDLQQRRDYNRRHWQKIKPIHESKRCEFCGKLFMPNKFTPKQPYCSEKCRLTRFKRDNYEKIAVWKRIERQKNKDKYAITNQLYKDKLRFGGNRLRALRRDNFTCRACGGQGERLNIHHLDWSGQSPKPNNKIENLQTLCAACHIRIHGHQIKKNNSQGLGVKVPRIP